MSLMKRKQGETYVYLDCARREGSLILRGMEVADASAEKEVGISDN
jgi:hypothetical protein